jgi:hypothetical protein
MRHRNVTVRGDLSIFANAPLLFDRDDRNDRDDRGDREKCVPQTCVRSFG